MRGESSRAHVVTASIRTSLCSEARKCSAQCRTNWVREWPSKSKLPSVRRANVTEVTSPASLMVGAGGQSAEVTQRSKVEDRKTFSQTNGDRQTKNPKLPGMLKYIRR